MIEAKTGLSLEETKYRLAFLLAQRIGVLGRWRAWRDTRGRRLVGAIEVVNAILAGKLSASDLKALEGFQLAGEAKALQLLGADLARWSAVAE